MEKISSILPSSPRVSAVDLRDAAPMRPGTPGFGRPEGASALRDREPIKTGNAGAPTTAAVARSAEIRDAQAEWKAKETRGVAIAKSMSDKFFVDRRREVESSAGDASGLPEAGPDMARSMASSRTNESRPANMHALDARELGAEQRLGSMDVGIESDLEAMPAPKGSFVDVRA